MTPLPAPLGSGNFMARRLDTAIFAATSDSGEGAYRVGGRWNGQGRRAVYCAFDPATAILEVAGHKGFKTLDTVAHALSPMQILDPALVHVVGRAEVPNPNWLVPGIPSAGQQAFGDQLLTDHLFVAIPSTVSKHSRTWSLTLSKQQAPINSSSRSLLRSTRGCILRFCSHMAPRPIPAVFDPGISKNAPLLAAEGFEIQEIQIQGVIK